MDRRTGRQWILSAGLTLIAGISTVVAELPTMQERRWLGYYAGFANRNYEFRMTPQGEAKIKVIGKNDKVIGANHAVSIDFVVEEILPDGRVARKPIIGESIQSEQPATAKIAGAGIVIRGKVKGDATFEIFLDESRGSLLFGGRLLHSGSSQNPLRLSIQAKFNDLLPSKPDLSDRKKAKAFEQKTKGDRLQYVHVDGERGKLSISDVADVSALSGPGIKSMELEVSIHQGKKFEFAASDHSSMILINKGEIPLSKGFTVSWAADIAKDPEGKARFSITVR